MDFLSLDWGGPTPSTQMVVPGQVPERLGQTSSLPTWWPQHQVLRYLNIKFYATSTKTQNAGGEEEDASESRHGGENEDENNKDKSFKKADSTSQPKNITTISHGNCVSYDAKMSKTNTKKK